MWIDFFHFLWIMWITLCITQLSTFVTVYDFVDFRIFLLIIRVKTVFCFHPKTLQKINFTGIFEKYKKDICKTHAFALQYTYHYEYWECWRDDV